jgi:hypothetical protein
LGLWIQNQAGKNDPQKKKKLRNVCLEVLDVLFGAGGLEA